MISFLSIKNNFNPDLIEDFNTLHRSFVAKINHVLSTNGEKRDPDIFSQSYLAAIVGIMMTYGNYPGRDKTESAHHIRKLSKLISGMFQNTVNNL